MKNSGIPWVGLIPNHWSLIRNKNLYSCKKEIVGDKSNDIQLLSLTTKGVIKKGQEVTGGKVPESYDTYQVVKKNNIVLCLFDLDCSAVFSGISSYDGMISPAYRVMSCNDGVSPKYADYWFSFIFDGRKYKHYSKNLRYTLSFEEFGELFSILPPLYEQQRIADFLDRKCADIDNVLEKTKASIEEYKKLKQSVITEAVTKGIRAERPMKDSGSAWFGKVPNDWEMSKLKYVFSIRKRIVGEDGHTVLAITQKGVKPKNMENGNGQFAESYANYQIVHPGDFAMNHMDLLTGWVDISKYEGVTSPDYRVFTLDNPKNCPQYYLYMMQMCYTNRIFYSMGQGVSGMGRWRLPADMFNNFLISVPPAEEQKEIASYLNQKCSEIDSLIENKERFIKELEAYRKSLVYEYVTGKKEVLAEA